MDMDLKPGQKVDLCTAMVVPAKGPGEETRVFAMFRLPVGTPLGSFEIREGEQGRASLFDLAGAVVQGQDPPPSESSGGGGGVGGAVLEGILGGMF